MTDTESRFALFDTARRRADWTVQQMWLAYVAAGGVHDAFHLEAYLAGLTPMAPLEQDVLAIAVNERLHDLYLSARVPYLLPTLNPDQPDHAPGDVIGKLLPRAARPHDPD